MEQHIRLLHLEDDARDAELIEHKLKAAGFRCDTVRVSGRHEFEAALQQGAFDLILCDYNLPGYDGLAALAFAREKLPDVPVILVTGSLGEDEAVESLKRGAADYLLKQRLERLGPAVQRALQEAEERRQRIRGEVALRESEELFRTLAAHAPVGILRTGANGDCVYCNETWCRMSGMTQEETLGRGWLHAIHPDDVERILREGKEAARSQTNFVSELRLRSPAGQISWALATAVPLWSPTGGIVGYVGTVLDMTERKQLEAQLLQAQKMEAIGRLTGGIAHDFNNQLFVIMGYTEMLLRAVAHDPTLRRPVEEIRSAAERAAQLTRQLLAFGRRQVLQPRLLDLNSELIRMQSMLGRLIGENCMITVKAEADPAIVRVDPVEFERVIMNLAANARDAMPHGGWITIATDNVDIDTVPPLGLRTFKPGPYVRVSVADSGVGMDEETARRIFEPFFTTKEAGKGTGLGLASVYGIVTQSGGHIDVSSRPGEGTTFHIYLPRVEGEPEVACVPVTETALPRGSETILVVDDQETVRTLLREVLEQHGYTVVSAPGGAEAIELAARPELAIDLLLTDIVMPGMSGRELCERLRALRPGLKFLCMTGELSREAGDREHLWMGGGVLLHKPITTSELLHKVRQTLDSRAGQELQARRVLVVDDSPTTAAVEAALLEEAGYVTLLAADGDEAWRRLQQETVDAVVTDVNMPYRDGFALTAAIRNEPRLQKLPVVVMTGAYHEEEKMRSEEVGADAYLDKAAPHGEGLVETLGRLFGGAEPVRRTRERVEGPTAPTTVEATP